MPVLQFKGKTAVENYHHTVPHHRLEFDAKLSLLGKGEKPSLDGNLIIEGDNLLALKALLPTHAGRVKCVYIDPPYNTGEEGWVYNDNLTQPQFKEWIGRTVGKEAEDACRHDKWCCMMYPRLTLLRELLSENGILFASIDDNEHGLLRLMLDEVFRTEMPLATFVWKRRSPTGMRADPVSVDHEYVLAYAKSPKHVELTGTVMTEEDYPYQDEVGRYASTDLTIGMSREDRPNQFYTLENPRTKKKYPGNPDRVWRFEPKEMKRVIAEDLIIWPEDHPGRRMTRPRFKTRFDPFDPKIKPASSWIEGHVRSESDDIDRDERTLHTGLNQEGGRILRRMFGKKVFNYPKPPSLIRSLVEIATGNGDIVLDSFAGSGTTGESVLRANARDGKQRHFILVQQPYDNKAHETNGFNVCRQVTAPRVKAVIQGFEYGKETKRKRTDGVGGNFTYFRVGEPLFSEYRDFGKKLPDWETLARYIFYTESGRECDSRKLNEKSGFIGSTEAAGGTSYYLHYSPDNEENERVSLHTLARLVKKDKNKNLVIYAERVWLHGDELARFEAEHGRKIRPMVVPFGLR